MGGSLAAVAGVIVSYRAYAHSQNQPGQQSFSVPVNAWRREAFLDFEVKKCSIGLKLVFCTLTVVSLGYDRKLTIASYATRLIDSDGDTFRMTNGVVDLTLERNQPLPFKLEFVVNKDVARPLTVKMSGSIDNQQLDKGFEIR